MSTISNLNELRWATDPGRTAEPPTAKKDEGHVDREEPSPLGFNWHKNKTFDRFKQLQGGENHKVVGLLAQKDNYHADLLLSELLDAALEAGDKIVFLEGIHVLDSARTLSIDQLELRSQSYAATIDVNGYILTLTGDQLRGELNIINAVPGSVVISGEDLEGLSIRINDFSGVDFLGSGHIKVNGKLISKELTTLEISNQPHHILMTASEQAQYSNDDRFMRFDPIAKNFKRRDNTVVSIDDGDWIVIKSVETLTAPLKFEANRTRIESFNSFQIPLGNQGSGIPYAVIIKGDSCRVDLQVDKTVRELAVSLGDDKYTPMSNNLTAMENRRVIKNQGEHNRIHYNGEMIFRGGSPTAHVDFVKPNHPYLLEWDSFIYDGLLRDLPGFPTLDNKLKCWFTDMYYWLDRRFNDKLLYPDSTIAYHTVAMPPRQARFMRQVGVNDPDRHVRAKLESYDDIIASADYTQVGDKIILQNNAARDIKNVKNGQRVQATGIPGGNTDTTIVRPGSIVTTPGSESFRMMNAENFNPITTSASGNITLNFSGMAVGSAQADAFQNITGSFEIRRTTADNSVLNDPQGAFTAFTVSTYQDQGFAIGATNRDHEQINFDASSSPSARATTETRALNFFAIPFYRL